MLRSHGRYQLIPVIIGYTLSSLRTLFRAPDRDSECGSTSSIESVLPRIEHGHESDPVAFMPTVMRFELAGLESHPAAMSAHKPYLLPTLVAFLFRPFLICHGRPPIHAIGRSTGLGSICRRKGSAGSGHKTAQITARHPASGPRAHQMCSVEICPCRIDFSRRECAEMRLMGRSTSMRRLGY